MKTITALVLLAASSIAAADYSTIVMTPQGPVMCTNVNGVPVCR